MTAHSLTSQRNNQQLWESRKGGYHDCEKRKRSDIQTENVSIKISRFLARKQPERVRKDSEKFYKKVLWGNLGSLMPVSCFNSG
jgi:hypothetical protein